MSLPRIPSNKTVIKPAVEEKVFPDRYILGMTVKRSANGKQPCAVGLQAYNFDTKELSPDPDDLIRFQIADIWAEAERSPTFAATLQQWVSTIMLLYTEHELREQLLAEPEGEARDALVAQLFAVQDQLQVPNEAPDMADETIVWAKPVEPE